jgi:hypothetical protein
VHSPISFLALYRAVLGDATTTARKQLGRDWSAVLELGRFGARWARCEGTDGRVGLLDVNGLRNNPVAVPGETKRMKHGENEN